MFLDDEYNPDLIEYELADPLDCRNDNNSDNGEGNEAIIAEDLGSSPAPNIEYTSGESGKAPYTPVSAYMQAYEGPLTVEVDQLHRDILAAAS